MNINAIDMTFCSCRYDFFFNDKIIGEFKNKASAKTLTKCKR